MRYLPNMSVEIMLILLADQTNLPGIRQPCIYKQIWRAFQRMSFSVKEVFLIYHIIVIYNILEVTEELVIETSRLCKCLDSLQ